MRWLVAFAVLVAAFAVRAALALSPGDAGAPAVVALASASDGMRLAQAAKDKAKSNDDEEDDSADDDEEDEDDSDDNESDND